MNTLIFPTDFSKSNIKYLLDVGCTVAVKVKYSMSPTGPTYIENVQLRYGDFCLHKYNLEFYKADWSEVIGNYMPNIILFINRDDLL